MADLPCSTNDERIVNGFGMMGLTTQDYPAYSDPAHFAQGFKICTLLRPVTTTTCSNSLTHGDKDAELEPGSC